jgi:hypothetical protein
MTTVTSLFRHRMADFSKKRKSVEAAARTVGGKRQCLRQLTWAGAVRMEEPPPAKSPMRVPIISCAMLQLDSEGAMRVFESWRGMPVLEWSHQGLEVGARSWHLHECEVCGHEFAHIHDVKPLAGAARYRQLCGICEASENRFLGDSDYWRRMATASVQLANWGAASQVWRPIEAKRKS